MRDDVMSYGKGTEAVSALTLAATAHLTLALTLSLTLSLPLALCLPLPLPLPPPLPLPLTLTLTPALTLHPNPMQAAMEDLGFYLANYSAAQCMSWGHFQGCGFVSTRCAAISNDQLARP